jgi:hypothetical protein
VKLTTKLTKDTKKFAVAASLGEGRLRRRQSHAHCAMAAAFTRF